MNILSSVADPGDGPRGHCSPPPLFLDQNEAQRAEKISFETAQLPSPPPPPIIRHWSYTHLPFLSSTPRMILSAFPKARLPK